jgi:hypothetical protein
VTEEEDARIAGASASPASSVVRPFGRDMIAHFVELHRLNYLTDSDGDFWIRYAYDPAIDGQLQIYIGAEGDDHNILVCRCEISRTFEPEGIADLLKVCNTWNEEKRWPKAFVSPDRTERLAVFLESQYALHRGAFDALVEDTIETFIAGSVQFWKTDGLSKAVSKRSKPRSKRRTTST